MTSADFITTANALTIAIVAPFAAIAAMSALKLLRVIVARVNASIRDNRKPTWRADWPCDATGVDVLGDGGRRLD